MRLGWLWLPGSWNKGKSYPVLIGVDDDAASPGGDSDVVCPAFERAPTCS